MKKGLGLCSLLLLTSASVTSVYGAASEMAPPRLFTLPPSEDHHIIKIERKEGNKDERRMIAAAEAATPQPNPAAGNIQPDNMGKGPSPLVPPYALTGTALAELQARIERYRKATFTYLPKHYSFSEWDEVGSSLTYSASVKKHDELQVKGEARKGVYEVDLSLSFVATQVEGGPFLDTICGFPEELSFRKTRRVLLDRNGKVLSIEGDGESPLVRKPIAARMSGYYGGPYETLGVALRSANPEGAKLWAGSIPDEEVRNRVLNKVSGGVAGAKKAAEEAKAWAISGKESPTHKHWGGIKGTLLDGVSHQTEVWICHLCKEVSVASRWAAVAPQEAGEWALRIKDPLARDGALAVVVKSWAFRSPKALCAWLKKHIEPASKRDLFLIDVIGRYAEEAPGTVVHLLPYLESEALRRIGRHTIANSWSYSQPWLALKPALEIEDASRRVEMLKNIARNWSQRGSVENARKWASRIPDEAERAQYLEAIKPGK